jgi:methylmalonyl-CoA mutase C-terminal domain/subunit
MSDALKVIVTMIGLDGHTTGGEVVSMILRDAGIEVVYLGVNQTPQMILRAAMQEDVDAVGISSHAANYSQIEELVQLLAANGMADVPVICGGNVPKHTAEQLRAKGVAAVVLPGASSEEIVSTVRSLARKRAA